MLDERTVCVNSKDAAGITASEMQKYVPNLIFF